MENGKTAHPLFFRTTSSAEAEAVARAGRVITSVNYTEKGSRSADGGGMTGAGTALVGWSGSGRSSPGRVLAVRPQYHGRPRRGARARGTALYLVLASAGWPVVKFCCASIFSSGAPTTRGPVGATFGAEVVQAAQCAGRVGRRSSGTVTTVPWPAAARASQPSSGRWTRRIVRRQSAASGCTRAGSAGAECSRGSDSARHCAGTLSADQPARLASRQVRAKLLPRPPQLWIQSLRPSVSPSTLAIHPASHPFVAVVHASRPSPGARGRPHDGPFGQARPQDIAGATAADHCPRRPRAPRAARNRPRLSQRQTCAGLAGIWVVVAAAGTQLTTKHTASETSLLLAAYELAAVDALCDSHVRAVAAMPPWRKPSCVARRQGRNAVLLADSAAPPPVC
ncbi:hypothetical protein ACCO45_001843 [Purpureocillium lilacinum]|uniref:Uncharacterized protein n=1 Tax=Purpureocillium lilacinum TaxID=33203 RepID=A0ACC4E9K5_PURLI